MIHNPKYQVFDKSPVAQGKKFLVVGVPSLDAFSGNKHSKDVWEKLFLGRLVKVVDMQYCKEGLVGVSLASVAMGSTNYIHEDCLMYFGVE
ncbi:hypothetical protein EKK58_12470 [Candidatus Dependentiae bacterium]|nr:MAG: hypothetical protein EKK58_12470 [Candidatus Dependentiae bacterium]